MFNCLKKFLKGDSLKGKIRDIKRDVEILVGHTCKEKYRVIWYGAYNIDPKHLVFWICVESDKIKLELKSNKKLMDDLRNLLVIYDYPKSARENVIIDFESQETVDRDSNGDWYGHFK